MRVPQREGEARSFKSEHKKPKTATSATHHLIVAAALPNALVETAEFRPAMFFEQSLNLEHFQSGEHSAVNMNE